MVVDESCQHWCQTDYATTVLIRGLRQAAALPEKTTIEFIKAGFATRSGLYFANPYLVDWLLAEAIRNDRQADSLRDDLLAEVIASLNPDYSFGEYDVALSTALGILTLGALGVNDRTILLSQMRLMELMSDSNLQTIAIPFYSTLQISEELSARSQVTLKLGEFFNRLDHGQKQIRTISGQLHSISLYLDTHQMITTALVALALAQPCDATQRTELSPRADRHPRYRCQNHTDYIAKFALPPYLSRLQESANEDSHDRTCLAVHCN
jgi:hypothetical protein